MAFSGSSNSLADGTIAEAKLSAFELAWAEGGKGNAIVPRRGLEYDPASILSYAPIEYVSVPVSPFVIDVPSLDWIREHFLKMVRGEPGSDPSRGPCPPEPCTGVGKVVPDTLIYEYLEQCESELVYGGLIESLTRERGTTPTEKILQIICHDAIGNKENRKYISLRDLDPIVVQASTNKLPLQFVVPAFPFKDQNPFRTAAPPDHVDLGEVALLIRLHVLALAVAQIYPFGAEWIIVSDGIRYARIFDIPLFQAQTYQNRIRDYRNRLNLHNTVHIIDLDSLPNRLGEFSLYCSGGVEEGGNFERVYQAVLNGLQELLKVGSINEQFDTLVRGMKWNINTRSLLGQYAWVDLWQALSSQPSQLSNQTLLGLQKLITERSHKAGLEYTAFNLSVKYLDLMKRLVPNSIRATVHAKEGQLAIPRLGKVFPWNGTATLKVGEKKVVSIRSMPLYKLLDNPSYSPAYLYGSNWPFYYEFRAVSPNE